MSAMQKLTLLNLKRNRVRTVVTIIGIVLSAALMTVVTGVVSSGRQTLIDTAINQNGDWTTICANTAACRLSMCKHRSARQNLTANPPTSPLSSSLA